MKSKLCLFATALFAWATLVHGQVSASYTVQCPAGWNLIANQVDGFNGNNVHSVFPSAPIGSRVAKFDLATKSFDTFETLTAAAGWLPGTNIFNPGDGLFFFNGSADTIQLTFRGLPHTPKLPINIGAGLVLIARQTNGPAAVSDVLGFLPSDTTAVYRFTPAPKADPNDFSSSAYTIYTLIKGTWKPSAPVLNVGESAWFTTNGGPPTVNGVPKNQTTCPGGSVTFIVTATGAPPLSYQWLLDGNKVPGATSNILSLSQVTSTNLGKYSAVVTNPFGSTTSASATLAFNPPPVSTGPSDTVACPGSSVTLTTTANNPAGAAPFTFAWYKDGKPLPNQTSNSITLPSVTTADAGTYCVVITGCGSTTNCASLTLGDKVPPTIFCPKDITTGCEGLKGTPVRYGVEISDNCDPKPTLTVTPPSGSLFPVGTTTVVCFAKDGSGNTNYCTFKVTVTDTTPPDIVCPSNQVVVASSNAGAKVFYAVTATDACDPKVTVTVNPPSGSLFPIGVTTVLATAADSSGNKSECRFLVHVIPPGCCDTKTWTTPFINPTVGQLAPSQRQGHSMAGDTQRGRVVLFGGSGIQGLLGDTWEWAGAWVPVASNGPSARVFPAMASDGRLGRTILFGGQDAKGASAETWAWDGTQWTLLTATGPSARFGHAMTYDSVRDRIVMFGGIGADNATLGDTWEFDGQKWAQVTTSTSSPTPRAGLAMAYSAAQRTTVMFGGRGVQGVLYGDTWSWNGTKWGLIATGGPPARAFSAMAYEDFCSRVVLFGGTDLKQGFMGDTWEWTSSGWSEKGNQGPQPRAEHAIAYDSANAQTLLFGGAYSDGRLNDTWLWALDRTPPQIASVYAECGDRRVVVAFSKEVVADTALDTKNYLLTCGGVNVSIVDVSLSEDGRIAILTLDTAFSGNGGCTLFLQNIRDVCGNPIQFTQFGVECTGQPCAKGSSGFEYWLTFPGNYAPDPTNQPVCRLWITGSPGTLGLVAMPGLPTPYHVTFVIPASGEVTVPLPRAADLGPTTELIEKKGIHVVASRPVSVYGYDHISFTTDAYLGLSTSALGQVYLAMTYQNVFTAVPELNGVQVAVVGTVNGTKVLIVPSVPVGSHPAGVPFAITLMRGETYQLRDTNSVPADLTGTIIVADEPVAVFGSHQCANLPTPNTFFCNYLVEQMSPAESWGTGFVTVPLKTRLHGDTFRILALYNATTVTINGVALSGVINQAHYRDVQLSASSLITSDKPILVAQFSDSSDYDGVKNSDPFMVLVPAVQLYSSSYTLQAPTAGFAANYINVMAQSASVGKITLDGGVVPAAAFSAVGASTFVGAQLSVAPGTHVVSTSDGSLFGVVAYGYDQYDAYGYPGGNCDRRRERVPPPFQCPPTNVVTRVEKNCQAPVPDLIATVGNITAATLATQDPAPGTLVGPGTYTVTVIVTDEFGNRHVCTTTLTVQGTPAAGLQCPANIVTNCTSSSGTVVSFQPTVCNPNAKVTCKPASGTMFPVGTTTVTCTATGDQGLVETCTFTVTVQCGNSTGPAITFGRGTDGTLTLAWPSGWIVQQASSVAGPWIPVDSYSSPAAVSPSAKQAFFRLVQAP